MRVNCCSVITATVHRTNEVRSDVDALNLGTHLAIYLMRAYELMQHCAGRFTKAIVLLTKASGIMEGVQVFEKAAYFILGEVKRDVEYICKIIGKIFMTVADACAALSWLAIVGVKTLAHHAAKIGLVGTVFALGGFAAFMGHAIQILVQNAGKKGRGLEIANGSFGLVSAVAETVSIVAAFITGQLAILLALGIFAKCMSLTSFFIGASAAKKEKERPAAPAASINHVTIRNKNHGA